MILSLFVFSNAFMSCIWRCLVKSKRSIAFCFAAGLLLIAIPISAHHGTSGYDMEKVITLNGTVTSLNWSNPHFLIHIDVKDSKGYMKDLIFFFDATAPTEIYTLSLHYAPACGVGQP